jgi:FkbM family methyltransferase
LIQDFITDIIPYFYGRPVIYVDAGAHKGRVFEQFAASALKLREAYLIEPNPKSFAALEKRLARIKGPKIRRSYNLALGAEAGQVRLSDADTMSRVVAEDAETGFEVECTTLDLLARDFVEPHVSVLKIDVEGFEGQVLAGAAGLLEAQSIDMIYLEAGMNPEGGQQSYYRGLEDQLAAQGCKLFRIYGQQHEWREDSPLLRRADFAFMSESFAARNPHKLSLELFALKEQAVALRADLEAVETRAREAEARLARARSRSRQAEEKYDRLTQSRSWRMLELLRKAGRALNRDRPPGA